MKIAMLAPIAWRTPPRHYGPWEQVASSIAEGLVAQGHDVSLFATGDSLTQGHLEYVCARPYEEDRDIDPKVWECLHIAHLMERAGQYDIIHNHFDFLPLTYSRLIDTPMVTTIHGFSSPKIIPVYKKYNAHTHYVSISDADRSPELQYIATVYHGIETTNFTLKTSPGEYLLFFGRIHPDKGTAEAIQIAKQYGMPLIMAGIIQDASYFNARVRPHIDDAHVVYVGHAGPDQRNALLGGAYALLHPIHFEEPFGLSVVESMLTGTPVVAFKRGSMPELIAHGTNGFLVDTPTEAVAMLDRVRTIDRTRCHQSAASKFSAQRMVDQYIAVYETIVGNG